MEDLDYEEFSEEEVDTGKQKVVLSQKDMEKHLEEYYETRKQAREEKQQKIRDAKQERKDRREQRFLTKEEKLKSRKLGVDEKLVKTQHMEEEEEEQPEELGEVHFKNPLAAMDDDELYISDNEEELAEGPIDPDEKMEGEISDDDAYVIPKAKTDMERRREQLKKNRERKDKKLKKDIEEGEDVGGRIEIVPQKTMDDYNIDELAETMVLAKKMLRNRSRDAIIDHSYGRFNFEDHEELPKWFAEDEKKHNFKMPPISKDEFNQEKERLMAINARVPKKILEARVRKKMRTQRKLKRTQKQAETVMSQEGLTEYNKLKQVSRLYDKSKRELKDSKKYVVSKKGRSGAGKDSRGVKHVDSRMKKDKRISKSRQVKRKHKRKGKF